MSGDDGIEVRARLWANEVIRGPACSIPSGFEIREPRETDQGYIASTWLRNLRTSEEHARSPRGTFFHELGAMVDRVLDRSDTRCLVAAEVADTDRMWGWIVWTPIPNAPALHYVYTRREHRLAGVAGALMSEAKIAAPFVYTLAGPDVSIITARYGGVFYSLKEFLA